MHTIRDTVVPVQLRPGAGSRRPGRLVLAGGTNPAIRNVARMLARSPACRKEIYPFVEFAPYYPRGLLYRGVEIDPGLLL